MLVTMARMVQQPPHRVRSTYIERERTTMERRPRKTILAALLTLTTTSVTATAMAETPERPSNVRISSINYQGSGCPSGSVAAILSTDGEALTLIFDSFAAELEGGSERRARSNCRIGLSIEGDRGWSFAVMAMEYRGYASIDAGAEGIQRSGYRFGNRGNVAIGRTRLSGEYDDNYSRVDYVNLGDNAWSRCRARNRLRINSSIAIRGRVGASGYMTVDSLDTESAQRFELVWKPCDRRLPGAKQFVAVCKAKGSTRRGQMEFTGQGAGRNGSQAMSRAMNRALRRCQNGDRSGSGISCSVQNSWCQTKRIGT